MSVRKWGIGVVAFSSLMLCISACCGGGGSSDSGASSRWEKKDAATATTVDGSKPADPKPAETKPPEPKPVEGGVFNKCFPADGFDGYKRVFTQEKAGFAEAKLQKAGKDVATLSISDTAANADARSKFDKATEKVSGYPLVAQGKNASAVLVNQRWQVKVMSQTLDEAGRKGILAKFSFAELPK